MGDENGQFYDLAALAKLEFLDMHRAVRNNPAARVRDYYALLTQFENDAPGILDSFNRVVSHEASDNDIQIVADTTESLERIGCMQFIPPIDELIKACKRGHFAFASESAEKSMGNHEKLLNRILAAKKPREELPAGYETQSLKNALSLIESGEAFRQLRILVVDDSTVMLNTVSSVLSDDYKVYVLAKPTMIEKFLEQITPELFLLDYEMPEINGFELIPIIRKLEKHKDTPIVFLTSLGTMEHVAAATKLGACDFIVKPFQPENLREKVARHIVWKE